MYEISGELDVWLEVAQSGGMGDGGNDGEGQNNSRTTTTKTLSLLLPIIGVRRVLICQIAYQRFKRRCLQQQWYTVGVLLHHVRVGICPCPLPGYSKIVPVHILRVETRLYYI